MEAAISEAVSRIFGTFVTEAVTGAIENTFTEAVDKAAEEKIRAVEERANALEEKVKATEEKLKAAEEKVMVAEDTYIAAVDKAVQEKVKGIEDTFAAAAEEAAKVHMEKLQEKVHRASRKAECRAWIVAVRSLNHHIGEKILTHKVSGKSHARCSIGNIHELHDEPGLLHAVHR